ncbi:GNAT family N-acetyltransferase [Bacillus sp. FJAT-49736]|uniref:GNAT family N-acetyltransferase n=1 Tax=Bacillus sp. FJAT-49736 TaxID=2833582 RepID=UPI001BC9AFA9|nr:GNAT family N-acetyltransferase [Bacillus sp. FJAT-49736]MBS4173348.1 GNAT family N-acetyltransferase [Bacillus sp. FJAT-49736]
MEPILIDFPEKIETERLYIRPCLPGDGKMVHDAISASLAELKPWMPWAQKLQTVEETEKNVRDSYASFIKREDIRLHIFRKSDDVFIGSTGLHRINWDVPKFEIGYWIDTRYAKNGYITEAMKGLTQFAFNILKAERMEIRCDTENINSRNVALRLGYTLEGILRNDSISSDRSHLRSTCVFSMLKEGWNK